jgi:hypothetical protein
MKILNFIFFEFYLILIIKQKKFFCKNKDILEYLKFLSDYIVMNKHKII